MIVTKHYKTRQTIPYYVECTGTSFTCKLNQKLRNGWVIIYVGYISVECYYSSLSEVQHTLPKPLLKLWRGWVITPHRKLDIITYPYLSPNWKGAPESLPPCSRKRPEELKSQCALWYVNLWQHSHWLHAEMCGPAATWNWFTACTCHLKATLI